MVGAVAAVLGVDAGKLNEKAGLLVPKENPDAAVVVVAVVVVPTLVIGEAKVERPKVVGKAADVAGVDATGAGLDAVIAETPNLKPLDGVAVGAAVPNVVPNEKPVLKGVAVVVGAVVVVGMPNFIWKEGAVVAAGGGSDPGL